MTENTDITNGQSFSGKTLKPKPDKVKGSPRKIKKSPTEQVVQSRGTVKQSEMVKWTIFVRPEVRNAVRLAAKKSRISDTAWMDLKLWELAATDLSKKPQPPAKPEDMVDMVNKIAERMKADQEAATQAQNALIEQQGAQIINLTQTVQAVLNQPQPSIIDRIFGKTGKAAKNE